jgi:uncharacterized membrane protein
VSLTTRNATVLFAAVGTAVSAYLTWVHYSGSLALCIGVGGCEAVQTSRYAMVGELPVAAIGLGGFCAMLGVAIARLVWDRAWLDLSLFGLSLAATLYVGYLTYVEIFLLGAICPWCVTAAACAVAVFALAARDLLSPEPS